MVLAVTSTGIFFKKIFLLDMKTLLIKPFFYDKNRSVSVPKGTARPTSPISPLLSLAISFEL